MNHWLVKTEPAAYAWANLLKDGHAVWTGVRNYQARNHLRAMKKGDQVLFYHSVSERQIVGLARVAREAYPDPTAEEGDWAAVELVPVSTLPRPVSLDAVKKNPAVKDIPLVKNSRLSVAPLSKPQFDRLMAMAGA